MQRRALLAALAGGTATLAGCVTASPTSDAPRVYNPTGHATVRPLADPFLRDGLTPASDQYLYGRLFRPDDSLAVTDADGAAQFATTVEELSTTQFAVLTNLRTAAAAPAYLWPVDTEVTAGRLRIDLERRTISSDELVDADDEAVGIAITTFDYDGDLPDRIVLQLPGGARLRVNG